jgi:hypothetical protein
MVSPVFSAISGLFTIVNFLEEGPDPVGKKLDLVL